MHGSGAVSCSCSLLIRGLVLPAVRQKLLLSPCADSRSRLFARSEAHINDYLFRGGPDTEKEDIELGEKFGVGEVVKSVWANAKQTEKEMLGNAARVVEEDNPKNFLSGAQPSRVASDSGVVEPKPSPKPKLGQPKIRLEQLFPKKKKPEPEAEPGPEPEGDGVSFGDEKPSSDDRPPILSKLAPYDTAKEFTRRYCFKEGVLAVYWYRGEFWEWNGRCYIKMNTDAINRRVWSFLDEAKSGHPNDASRFRAGFGNLHRAISGASA